jgi:lipoprotein LprG
MRRVLSLLASVVLALVAVACSGDPEEEQATPEEVMGEAKATLDDTTGLRLVLDTEALPEGVAGITNADGVATADPAFDGVISIIFAGQSVEVPVVSVDEVVYAQLPLTTGWSEVDPAEYGAPDPAALVDPETGFSSLLPATEDLERGGSVRGGADNNEILTEYTGTVPGDAMANVIPSAEADGTFDATYTVSDSGELREAVLTGVFYPDSEPMTYTVDFTEYGTEQEIAAPSVDG